MPLRPDFIERILFLRANQAPGPLLDLLGALSFKSVLTALRLGVFEALHAGPADADELATRLNVSPRGLRFLLDTLEPLGYVACRGAKFRNTPMTEKWLVASAEAPLGDLFQYFGDVAARWDQLDRAVRVGGPGQDTFDWNEADDGRWRRYHAGMRAAARLLAPEVVARVKLPASARRLLDLGGSHGLFAARFCRAHSELTAVVLDFAAAREVAEETIEAEGLRGRVEFRAGDFLAENSGDAIGTAGIPPANAMGQNFWDVVLLFSVARVLPRETLGRLLRRIAEITADGGQLVLLDQLAEHPASPFRRANARLIELELFSAAPGDLHRADDLSRWIAEAGFTPPRRIRLRRAGGQELLVAKKIAK
jgi:SAM-dependent methyltransferase